MRRRRPLLGLALVWMLGIGLGRAVDPAPFVIGGSTLGVAALAVVLFRRGHPSWELFVLTLVGLLGALALAQSELPTDRLYPRLDELESVRGVVVDFPTQTDAYTTFVLDDERLPGGVQVFYWHQADAALEVAHGDRLTIATDVEIPSRLADFDYRGYLATRNVWGVASVWNASQIERRSPDGGHPLLRRAYQARHHLFETIDAHLPSPQRNLLKGLLFGERAYMSDRVEGSFRDAGVMHVLAVSGLHLAILLGLGWVILRKLGRSITTTYLVLLPLTVGYLAIVGFKLSLVRATLMLAFVALGWVIAERGWILKNWIDSLQGLSAAALLILVLHPPTLFNVSFQLSFSATAGILIVLNLASPRLNAWRDGLQRRWDLESSRLRHLTFTAGERLAMLGVITGAAQIAVAPVIAWHFHRLYMGAFLANLVIVPIVTVVLWLALAFLATAALGLGGAASVAGLGLATLLALLIETTNGFARLPWAYLVVDRGIVLTTLALLPMLLRPMMIQALRATLTAPRSAVKALTARSG